MKWGKIRSLNYLIYKMQMNEYYLIVEPGDVFTIIPYQEKLIKFLTLFIYLNRDSRIKLLPLNTDHVIFQLYNPHTDILLISEIKESYLGKFITPGKSRRRLRYWLNYTRSTLFPHGIRNFFLLD